MSLDFGRSIEKKNVTGALIYIYEVLVYLFEKGYGFRGFG